MRKILLSLCAILFFAIGSFAQTAVQGKVQDKETGEALPFATVTLTKNGVFITGTDTDFDGNYSISGLEPGTYDVEASYVGYTASRQVGVVVKAGKANKLDFGLSEGEVIEGIEIVEYRVPLVEQDNTTQGKTVTAESIRSLPTRSVAGIAATSAGLTTSKSGDISVRGSRTDATYYYIDGVRVRGAVIPTQEIEQMQVITGGIEAKYGDVTGGVISITSKGPSQRFTGGLEMETSEYLDDFGQSLIAANVSGPIWKNSEGKSIIGFRASGQYRYRKDDFPSALGVYRLSEEGIANLEANPVSSAVSGTFPTAELLTTNDIPEPMSYRPNEEDRDMIFTGKIDARISDNIDVSLSGSYNDSKNRFTPSAAWGLLNWTNNPYAYSDGFRANFRFRHKLGSQGFGQNLSDEEKAKKNSSIRNAFYSVLLGYEKRNSRNEDVRHEDRLGHYGFFGNENISYIPEQSLLTDPDSWGGDTVFDNFGRQWAHQGYTQVPGEEGFVVDPNVNPVLGQMALGNGILNSTLTGFWSGLYSNVGQVYNSFAKGESDIYTFNVTTGFDFLPGGSESGRHNIQIGVMYEQQTNRSYSVAPQGLWTAALNNANRHILGVDTTNSIGTFDVFNPQLFGPDTIQFTQYQTLLDEDVSGNLFYKRIRDVLGLTLNDYVNTDGLSPDQLTLDLFAPSELTDPGLIGYYGYDYLGNKIGSNVTFDDFFTGRTTVDGTEIRSFEVAPLTPIYGAAYIQDKFTYKDIIFRLGVRLDYYDANTKVLKDPYALYDIETASDFFARTGQTRPEAVGDDYKVYVGGPESDNIVGYRRGDEWFLPNGTSVGANGNLVFNGALVNPSYKGRFTGTVLDIRDEGFTPETSFDDYDPQLNFMPRLAFSFPINEDANFFAHYDVLVQRPASGTAVTALNYYYFEDPQRTPANNANLLPEKTIDYEVGFQQRLNQSSALKISLFYKELRDMIQRRVYQFVPQPVEYTTTSNLDFGTVKGISIGIDRRRTNNLELSASYTLQFANGTGSDINSSNGINSRGPIRNLLPFSYDERHRIAGTVDYRYGSGKRYNGPRIGGYDIFANTGVNFIVNAVSGRPYTRNQEPAILGGNGFLGSINGARLPWQFNIDARLDKQFSFALGSDENSRQIGCNIYLRVSNLLDTRNVVGVYPATGDPDDDGYLLSSIGQDQLITIASQGKDIAGFLSSYQWRVLNGGFYSFPRQIFLGAIFDF